MATALKQSAKQESLVWQSVVRGDTNAFEQIVVSHQSAVSAVAFNIIGDFAISQDIAQETFWAAWKTRDSLRDPKRLKAWLCGISRNLAKQWRRKKSRRDEISSEKFGSEFDSAATDPADEFISKEEESVVWKALEEIPLNYREVLVLYYRQDQSIEEVADSLHITNSAARQRLVRGREMLRTRVSNMIEGVLDRTNPTQTFTARVMVGVISMSVAASSSAAKASSLSMTVGSTTASTAVGVAKLLGGGSTLGLAGGLLGGAGGLLGGWIGTWLPAQLAETETERQLLLERGGVMIRWSIYATLLTIAASFATALDQQNRFFWGFVSMAPMIALMVPGFFYIMRTNSLVNQLKTELSPEEDPNQSFIGKKLRSAVIPTEEMFGRRYTSKLSFLGLPLIDIQMNDPQFHSTYAASKIAKEDMPTVVRAKGWIAIGDIATGFIALGGRTLGVFSMGGVSAGIVSLGGLSFGLISFGGLAVGLLAIGGVAIGYDAAGGGAIGWHSAAGGGAVAWHVAMGGGALAHDFAAGGGAYANEANTELARQVANEESLFWLMKYHWWAVGFSVAISIVAVPLTKLLYTDTPPD